MLFPSHITDCHAHDPRLWRNALISVSPGQFERLAQEYPEALFSVGIHPWDADKVTPQTWQQLEAAAHNPRVLAIGEAGLDKLRGPSMERQLEVLEPQIRLSEEVGKPVVLHVVRAIEPLLALRKRLRPTQPWIIHGFRGKPQQAAQLLAMPGNPFYLSLGPDANPSTLAAIAPCRLLRETDAPAPAF